jgi:ribosomal protein L7Ae-like RNA K-turn-binding protein
MSKIAIDKLQSGMKLAKPVINMNGLVMLAEDTELTETLIQKIGDMDIPGVYIQGMTQPDIPKEEMLAGLDKRFKNVEKEPYMDVIKQALKERIEGLYGQT